MFGDVVPGQEWGAGGEGAGGEVLGQLAAYDRVGDDAVRAGGGDDLLDLPADVGGVPRRPPGAEPEKDQVGDGVAVEAPNRCRGKGCLADG